MDCAPKSRTIAAPLRNPQHFAPVTLTLWPRGVSSCPSAKGVAPAFLHKFLKPPIHLHAVSMHAASAILRSASGVPPACYNCCRAREPSRCQPGVLPLRRDRSVDGNQPRDATATCPEESTPNPTHPLTRRSPPSRTSDSTKGGNSADPTSRAEYK